MASAPRSSGGGPRGAPEPAGDGVVWHSTCGYAECVEPAHYAADFKCAGCRRIKYCTAACQKADWKRHKAACKADEAADEAAARAGALVALPRARPPPEPTLLLKAAETGNVRYVEALLRLGADVNACGAGSTTTALFVASQQGHVAAVSALLAAAGVTVNTATTTGTTPLVRRVAEWSRGCCGGPPLLLALLSAPGIHVSVARTDGATPLHIASERGHAAVVAALLAATGVSVNAAMRGGATPLFLASQHGHADVVAALLAAPGVSVNLATVKGATPLFIASQCDHAAVVAVLLAAPGLAVNAATNEDGWTPLHIASYLGHAAVVSELLECPTVDVNPRTTRAQPKLRADADASPLRLARDMGHLGVAALLEARGGVV